MSSDVTGLKIGAPLPTEKILSIILEALHELVNYELAVVMRLDSKDILRVEKAIGPLYTDKLNNFTINLNYRQDIAELLKKKSPRLFEENESHVDTYAGVLHLPENHSCLAAPLYIADTTIGLLTLDHRKCSQFTPEIVRFISALSKLVSVALAQTDASQILAEKTEKLLLERNTLLENSADSQVFKNMIGSSRAWTTVLDSIKLVAVSDAPVLISGETGTGKEQAARTIHKLSSRAEKPFIPVNCSALVKSLAESELFGHEKGAFSGAAGMRKGRFELANGGTLFLDEVGDLPMELQPKLLRVLQDGVFERVGGEKSVYSNVRIIAATNIDLAEAVSKGDFREDLLYRLDVFPLHMPSLRERGDDVELLAEHFISAIRKREGFEKTCLSKSAVTKLFGLKWYGNIRELQNVIERAAILARGGVIEAEHLVPGTRERYEINKNKKHPVNNLEEIYSNSFADRNSELRTVTTFKEGEKRIIQTALDYANGKIYGTDGAAALLNLKPTTLQSKMKRLGIRAQKQRAD